ncbi:adenosylcobinamide-phosphate synthase CbiB [Siphonobacter sp. SORGH_AS_0500]|uniref:adenosylcobinamide-phosphate synthase CbiB n=1 Tax=Siphonobacter sp. SORGH_AS_0500 TaxID=1864824 RepID=UPI002861A8A9|nr:adenosylcobinamide-phosphate synthase CbiB [Siphonobacter sp. SORGH_AS_0500]MDR6197852.1 adenosylcobinamide-phosphate synthase [Siphonobacter sp. SORGH_AS_0500]
MVLSLAALFIGYALDLFIGDPDHWPHPIRVFGNAIYAGEKRFNTGNHRFWKGLGMSLFLCLLVFAFFTCINHLLQLLPQSIWLIFNGIMVWYGLANHNLISEGKNVFKALNEGGVEAGRTQLSRIVGRDTRNLSPQQIRIAVLETMSENLSDGVIAPLFYYALAGVPGMMTYKMINTLDSMIGYRNERYEQFGKFAARLDDVANFIPARLTALLMILVTFSKRGLTFVFRYGNQHKSPNSGYPEAALAGILNCRFGGPNVYHGKLVDKPYIGATERMIEDQEIKQVSRINHLTCLWMILLIAMIFYALS